MIATRVDGYADGDPPNPTAIRSEWPMLSRASTISAARARRTPRQDARKHEISGQASTPGDERGDHHQAHRPQRAEAVQRTEQRAQRRAACLKRSKTARSLRVTSPWWSEVTIRARCRRTARTIAGLGAAAHPRRQVGTCPVATNATSLSSSIWRSAVTTASAFPNLPPEKHRHPCGRGDRVDVRG